MATNNVTPPTTPRNNLPVRVAEEDFWEKANSMFKSDEDGLLWLEVWEGCAGGFDHCPGGDVCQHEVLFRERYEFLDKIIAELETLEQEMYGVVMADEAFQARLRNLERNLGVGVDSTTERCREDVANERLRTWHGSIEFHALQEIVQSRPDALSSETLLWVRLARARQTFKPLSFPFGEIERGPPGCGWYYYLGCHPGVPRPPSREMNFSASFSIVHGFARVEDDENSNN